MLIDRYPVEDVFARVPELADQTDPVLVQLDYLLDDDVLYQQVRADLAQRYRLTLVHGRPSTPAEVILRLLVVQHLYAWSYAETVERVADSLVLRWFVRIYFRHVPDATTLLRWAHTIRPETLHALTDRVAVLARQVRVTRARKLRLDSTCVQTPIHHPTDSGLLGDSVRVLTRLIRQARPLVQDDVQHEAGSLREVFRSRMRTVRRVLQHLHRVRRQQGEAAAETQRTLYARLLTVTRQTVRQAERVRDALQQHLPSVPAPSASPVDTSRSSLPPPPPPPLPASASAFRRVTRLHDQLQHFLPLVMQVIAQAQRRVLDGQMPPSSEKVLSLFEPHTRLVTRHKGGAAVEFGRQVEVDEIDGGIVTRVHVLADDESERHQALPAVQHHRAVFGRAPTLVTGDRGTHTKDVEIQAIALGVRQVAIPRSGPTTATQRAREHSRPWRRRYRWRAGIEGRIHVLRRDFGLRRVRSHGLEGFERDVGWGVVAYNLRQIARRQAPQRPRRASSSQQAA